MMMTRGRYDIKIIMMNIALTYLSFLVFILDPQVCYWHPILPPTHPAL